MNYLLEQYQGYRAALYPDSELSAEDERALYLTFYAGALVALSFVGQNQRDLPEEESTAAIREVYKTAVNGIKTVHQDLKELRDLRNEAECRGPL